MMLAMAHLRDIPDETANRMMMSHGSRMMLSALRGEVIEFPAPKPVKEVAPPRKKTKAPYIPVNKRPIQGMPDRASRIINAVANAFELDTADVLGTSRKLATVIARSLSYRLIRDCIAADGLPYSFPRIASMFNRDHSTVCHSLDMFEVYCKHHPRVAEIYAELREMTR